MPYHVRIGLRGRFSDLYVFDLDANELHSRIVTPWHRGAEIVMDGSVADPREASSITIVHSAAPARAESGNTEGRQLRSGQALAIINAGDIVTERFIEGPAGCHMDRPVPEAAHELVIRICGAFPAMVRGLSARERGRPPLIMEDEYDVQYLLMGALRLFFDDIRPEETMPSHAGKRPRADFLLADDGIIVETKMVRDGLTDGKVSRELADDFERYRAHPACKRVIVLVYDPEQRLNGPRALEKACSGDRGDGITVHTIVAP